MHFYIKIITILFMFYFSLNGIFGFIYILLDAETRSDVNRGVFIYIFRICCTVCQLFYLEKYLKKEQN